MQVKPTLTACKGKITIINPVVTSKGKFSKLADNKFVQGQFKETLDSKGTNQRTEKACPEPEDLEEDTLETVVDGKALSEILTTLPFTFQFNRNLKPEDWKDMVQVLQLHQLHKDLFQWSMENKSGQESPFFTLPGGFQEKTRTQGKERYLFSLKAERVRPKTQEQEVVVNHSRISSPLNRNITPTHIEHNAVSPESHLNSAALWLQISQYAEQTQKKFSEIEASHEWMKKLTAFMDRIVKTLQEGHAQLRKASEGTHKRLNIVFEEQNHSRRDRECLDKDIKKLLNVYHNMKPQPQGHVMDNPYYQDDMKPDTMLVNKARSPSQYQDGDNMSYYEKEALKQLPEASSWPQFSGTEEYDNMELIDYINGLFIDLPSIPDYWITARLNTAFKGHASIWYTEIKEIHGRRNWPWWKRQIIQNYSNGTSILQATMSFENDKYSVGKDPYEWCLRQSKTLKAIDPQMNIQMRNHKHLTQMPGEPEHAVKCRCNQKCTLDDISHTLHDVRKRTNIGKFTP
ncbi:hypothetical protein O181_030725 [Austropuccinia psidii MF-1]|uniref:Uncharacterized protein n=1 Tax=Austropuccinia psidii MF-1 TaxID=1389203 RepID=A0A9Q3CWP5_9BASI|nr:hypothetical protein [Austropuccinia psidii MF-1]